MSSVTTMISRPGSSAIASFNSGVTLVAGVCCCEMAGTSAPAPSITISATADWSVRPGAPMVASSQVLRCARRGCQIRSGRSKLAGRRRRLHRAPSDDGFALGYITYLLVDYEVKVRYRFAMLRILREQSCNDGEDAQGAHESRKARLHQWPVFGLFRPVLAGEPGRLNWRRDARVSCLLAGAYGEVTGGRLCRASCFRLLFTGGELRERAIPVRAGTGRPHRRSRRVQSRRSPPPCGRRGRACGRQAPRGDYWASPSPRRGEARARSPIRRDAG